MKTAEEVIKEKGTDMISVPIDSTVFDALKVMNEKKIGAILVKNGNDVAGIWTERDLLHNAMEEGFDPKTAKIADYMTTDLKYSDYSHSMEQLQDKFLGIRLRHLLIKKEETLIGLLSVGDVMKTILNDKEKELRELNEMTSWEYYENWRWKKE